MPTYFGHASLIICASASQVEFYLQQPACAADLLVHLAFDQAAKLSDQTCAFCSKGCESLVLICEISAGSGVTGKLGVAGCCGADFGHANTRPAAAQGLDRGKPTSLTPAKLLSTLQPP
ncbi:MULTISPECIES: hypothetical protein [Comamonas]|uniref:hypothetical protein n=1 Tax=Comamonas TaxID=283 RepID=UPI0013F48C50|nr:MULTISPECIES: hypothetical protein [Comamonas]UNV93091.1 hypothetical protein MP576_12470 [Comamonas sp. 7D-2evo1]UNV93611.1 hypothetical protein MPZ60_13885 [Comamonas sp. 7D-2]UNW02729.1 hypothetical protein MP579_12465 [Comamonas sp. 7D-2evo2]